jgi:acetolactate synthase-1/2/3 large subunit
MEKSRKGSLNRRGFLKGAAVGAAAGAAGMVVETPNAKAEPAGQLQRGAAPPPSPAQLAAETEPVSQQIDVLRTIDDPGSDFMVDVIKSLGFEYVASMPGSSFRGLQESFINYGGNQAPEWLTCLHEESSIAIADGYFRVEGKPMLAIAHGTVGLQHAAMTIYHAFCAHTPVFIILGNHLDATGRRPGVEWNHSVQDATAMVRDYIKWDDTPHSLQHFAESAVRAYKIGMTVPTAPTVLVADGHLQEAPIEDRSRLHIPKLTRTSPPAGDPGAVAEVAQLLVGAENPVIVGGNVARSQQGMDLMVELAETLQVPVRGYSRNMPSRHPLSGGGAIGAADVILGMQVEDLWGTVHNMRDLPEKTFSRRTQPGTKLISIDSNDLFIKSNYQDFQRYAEVDLAIAADAEATLPSLIEACKRLITGDRRRVFEERGKTLSAAKDRALAGARTQAASGWDASPVSTARLWAELWEVVRNKDWALVNGGSPPLWNFEHYHQTIENVGSNGAAAVGARLPIAVGAALAHRKYGRFCVAFQTDGDLMCAPGALWTAVHHRIPMLFLMHNNRAYHQEVMHLQRMANWRQRAINTAGIGNDISDPDIDYATVARGMGLYGEGPISDPSEVGPALRRAVERVENGETALVDVVSQPR